MRAAAAVAAWSYKGRSCSVGIELRGRRRRCGDVRAAVATAVWSYEGGDCGVGIELRVRWLRLWCGAARAAALGAACAVFGLAAACGRLGDGRAWSSGRWGVGVAPQMSSPTTMALASASSSSPAWAHHFHRQIWNVVAVRELRRRPTAPLELLRHRSPHEFGDVSSGMT
uniref:Uncharacterized protein n=1 Tax=Oryza nivara TaxID=4536 RepID=A0A0E0IRL8_ORYNI